MRSPIRFGNFQLDTPAPLTEILMNTSTANSRETIQWIGQTDGHLRLIYQTLLPENLTEIDCRDIETVWEAIKMLRVRGAPAIGIAAAYGVTVGLGAIDDSDADAFWKTFDKSVDYLATSRPTAVNLFWALDRLKALSADLRAGDLPTARQKLLEEAQNIHQAVSYTHLTLPTIYSV